MITNNILEKAIMKVSEVEEATTCRHHFADTE
jgi:hypothetical protein